MKFKINWQIDEIILEGVSLSRRQRIRLQEALEAELSSLVSINGLPYQIQQGRAIPKLSVTPKITRIDNFTSKIFYWPVLWLRNNDILLKIISSMGKLILKFINYFERLLL